MPNKVKKTDIEIINQLNSFVITYDRNVDKQKLKKYLKVRKVRRLDIGRIAGIALPTVDKFLNDVKLMDKTELWITYCLSKLLEVKFDAFLEAFKKENKEE